MANIYTAVVTSTVYPKGEAFEFSAEGIAGVKAAVAADIAKLSGVTPDSVTWERNGTRDYIGKTITSDGKRVKDVTVDVHIVRYIAA